MSILDRIARPQRRGFPRHLAFRLTEGGRDKLQDFTGDPQSRVLIALETRQASATVDEIAQTSRLSVGAVERMMPRLVQAGYVQPASAADGDVF